MNERGWPSGHPEKALTTRAVVRELPHSTEAEQGTLGSMLISREAVSEAAGKINPEYFYVPAHQTIFQEMIAVKDGGKGIDLITFTQILRDKNLLETVGGAVYITSLFTFVPTAANIFYYLEILRDKYILRQIIAAGTMAVRRAYEEQDEVNNLLDDVQASFTTLALDTRFRESMRHVSEGVDGTMGRLGIAFENRGENVVSGVATGFFDLDRRCSGFKPGQMIVVAARPSHGKTALAMNIAEHAAIEQKIAVAVFSMEMSFDELVDRLILSRAEISLQRMRDGKMSAERDFPRVAGVAATVGAAPIYIDDTPALRIFDFKARARRIKQQKDVGLIVVDYIQLMRSASKRAMENRVLEITEISGAIKAVAKELRIPIIVLAQLNRDAEKRSMGKPKLSDLRESGAIEQDADVVALLSRPIRHCDSEQDRINVAAKLKIPVDELKEYAEVNLAKQRNGPVGEIRLLFIDELTRFKNVTAQMWSNREDQREHHDDDV